jgi:hypothetical protein
LKTFIFHILVARVSYIDVLGAMKIAVPKVISVKSSKGFGCTFPLNITLGMPIYFDVILSTK